MSHRPIKKQHLRFTVTIMTVKVNSSFSLLRAYFSEHEEFLCRHLFRKQQFNNKIVQIIVVAEFRQKISKIIFNHHMYKVDAVKSTIYRIVGLQTSCYVQSASKGYSIKKVDQLGGKMRSWHKGSQRITNVHILWKHC